ncbi:hypothetical protein RND71_013480 [Anisodus tanguticus]|uniref:Uncharacterized protein n=1 Tax=Anisodus tanguticus TaxID=243964 RepID=A0AAE1S9B2_9SOLA|nr:hypothetical protein RND71_013480 [Anisodus tanguticus]
MAMGVAQNNWKEVVPETAVEAEETVVKETLIGRRARRTANDDEEEANKDKPNKSIYFDNIGAEVEKLKMDKLSGQPNFKKEPDTNCSSKRVNDDDEMPLDLVLTRKYGVSPKGAPTVRKHIAKKGPITQKRRQAQLESAQEANKGKGKCQNRRRIIKKSLVDEGNVEPYNVVEIEIDEKKEVEKTPLDRKNKGKSGLR